jgi:hypothetical protein
MERISLSLIGQSDKLTELATAYAAASAELDTKLDQRGVSHEPTPKELRNAGACAHIESLRRRFGVWARSEKRQYPCNCECPMRPALD